MIDSQNIKDFNYLLNPNEYLRSKYSYEDIINIEITKIDTENWSITGDLEKIIKSNNFQNEFIESLQRTLDDKVSKYLKGLQIEFSEKNNHFQKNGDSQLLVRIGRPGVRCQITPTLATYGQNSRPGHTIRLKERRVYHIKSGNSD